VILRGRWTREDREEELQRLVPLEVPEGAAAVAIEMVYERTPESIVDVGLFDPDGFRGWSGSDKLRIVVREDEATPSYLPGPLVPGEWQVLHGLHRVPPGGLEWELRVEFGPAVVEPMRSPPPRPARPPRRDLPAAEGRRWLAGDLHSHTVHSDGFMTVAELACFARSRGLDFLALTDHNTTSHFADIPAAAAHAEMILLPGFELTTDFGHANCIGATRWVDFRRGADDWLADAEASGALLSVNHPLLPTMEWRQPMSGRPPLLEVWHSSTRRRLEGSLAWWEDWRAGIPVGGSDFHRIGNDGLPGEPTTWVEAEGDDVLGAIRAGRVAISADPQAPVIVPHEGELVVVDGEGATLLVPDGDRRRIVSGHERLAAAQGPWRLVDDGGETLALTVLP
jgi:hypothetical protein